MSDTVELTREVLEEMAVMADTGNERVLARNLLDTLDLLDAQIALTGRSELRKDGMSRRLERANTYKEPALGLAKAVRNFFTPGPGVAMPERHEPTYGEPHNVTWNSKLDKLEAALATWDEVAS